MSLTEVNTECMTIVSIISVITSASIVASYLLFFDTLYKQTNQAIFFLSLSTMLTCMGSSFGTPPDNTAACWFEGIGTTIFTLSSIFWCVVIDYMLYAIIIGKPYVITTTTHILCWGFPTLVALLPLINARYGNPDNSSWCFVADDDRTPAYGILMWTWVSYYSWIWLSVFAMVFLLLRIYMLTHKIQREHTLQAINKVIRKLILYPPIIILCWILATVYDSIVANTASGDDMYYYSFSDQMLNITSSIMACSQGVLITFAFWYTSDEMKKRWYVFVTTGKRFTGIGISSPFSSPTSSLRSPFSGRLLNLQFNPLVSSRVSFSSRVTPLNAQPRDSVYAHTVEAGLHV